MRNLIRVLTASLALWACLSCSEKSATEAEADGGHVKVVATVGMIADIAREVAGDRADVENIIGEGVDPHLYKPTSADVKKIQAADVVFYNGLMLEGKMSDILVRVASSGRTVVPVSETLMEQEDYVMSDEEEHYDPHVWMDVSGWIAAVKVVADSLSEFDPEAAQSYQSNAANYIERLNHLDGYAKKVISSIPAEKRVLVTAHDAFHYMARAYGLEVRGIQGFSTESEAGVKDIEDLVSFLVDREIPAIFVESSVSDKNIQALAEGARARNHEVVIGGELFSDAMGPAGTYEGTYIGMIDHNVTTIARALGGEAPEKGLNGTLSH